MKSILERLFVFFGAMFSAKEDVSVKRFSGFIILLVLLNLSYFAGFKLIDAETWKVIEGFLTTLLYSADILLGIGALIDGAKIIKGTIAGKPGGGEPKE